LGEYHHQAESEFGAPVVVRPKEGSGSLLSCPLRRFRVWCPMFPGNESDETEFRRKVLDRGSPLPLAVNAAISKAAAAVAPAKLPFRVEREIARTC
jgi:hypothetical protein